MGKGKKRAKGKETEKREFREIATTVASQGIQRSIVGRKEGETAASIQEQWMQKEEEVKQNRQAQEAA